jgi:putative SOS response-associated peptidase YedK
MCGRVANPIPFARLVGLMRGDGSFPVVEPPDADGRWRPSWNVAPRTTVPALVATAGGAAEWRFLRWGLVPRWASDPAVGDRLINARGETVAEKPSFRDAWRKRRCLVPVAAFYEWRKLGSRREPWAFGPGKEGGEVLWLGGIHESWTQPDGGELSTFAIVTTAANAVVAPVHDRMPVVVAEDGHRRWLGLGGDGAAELPQELVVPAPPEAIRGWRVSAAVNDARRDGAECLEPVQGLVSDPVSDPGSGLGSEATPDRGSDLGSGVGLFG